MVNTLSMRISSRLRQIRHISRSSRDSVTGIDEVGQTGRYRHSCSRSDSLSYQAFLAPPPVGASSSPPPGPRKSRSAVSLSPRRPLRRSSCSSGRARRSPSPSRATPLPSRLKFPDSNHGDSVKAEQMQRVNSPSRLTDKLNPEQQGTSFS